jgi:hypothetical protein
MLFTQLVSLPPTNGHQDAGVVSLLSGRPAYQESRISPAKECSFADNFLQKQQKQRSPFSRRADGPVLDWPGLTT